MDGTDVIAVVARCGSGYGDQAAFDHQVKEVKAAGLEYSPGGRSWRGTLSTHLRDALSAWEALVQAARAGADVELTDFRTPDPARTTSVVD